MIKHRRSSESRWQRFWRELSGGIERPSACRSMLGVEQLERRLLMTHAPADHVHAQLSIVLDGQVQPIPAEIGLSAAGHFNPHTHDTDSILHIGEGGPAGLGNDLRLVTLDDFFDVWRERGGFAGNNPNSRFDATHILNQTADATHVVRMFVNGQLNTEFEHYTPHDDDVIVIRYDSLPASPGSLTLLAASDSGSSNSDRVTSVTSWQIQVSGVSPGAVVELRSGGKTLGQSTASGTTVTVTAGVSSLSDGVVNVNAVQSVNGLTSPLSSDLAVTLDRVAPLLTLAPPAAMAGQNYSYDVNAADEGQAGFNYNLVTAPAGATIAPTSGVITWSLVPDAAGVHQLAVQLTDPAGNQRNVSSNLYVVEAAFPWRNPVNELDVNGDSIISPLDVLLMVNRINGGAPNQLPVPVVGDASPPFHDVTGDNLLTPLDVLLVVNFLNAQADGEGESGVVSG